jgi:hypothetical protein
MQAPRVSNPNGARGQDLPAQHDSDGSRELRRTFEQARIGGHEYPRRQRNDRRYWKAVPVRTGRMRQNAGEVMMKGAALIVGIYGTMVMVVTALVDVVMMGMIDDSGAGNVGDDVLFGRHGMLKMDGNQGHYTDHLGNQKQPKKPPAKASFGAQRNHFVRFFVTAGLGHGTFPTAATKSSEHRHSPRVNGC